MTAPVIQFGFYGESPALAALLAEQLAGRTGVAFQVLEAGDLARADILVIANRDVGDIAAPNQTRVWIGKGAPAFAAAAKFDMPVQLAAVLDAAFTHYRLAKIKTPRALGPGMVFDPFTRMLTGNAGKENLSEREASFLLALADAGENGITRQDAVTEVWGWQAGVESHAVETTAYRLRQKMQAACGEKLQLVAEKGSYRLTTN